MANTRGRVITVATEVWQAWWFRSVAAAAALVACVGGVNLWQARQAEKAVVATLVEARGQVSGFRVQVSGGRFQGSGSPESGVRSPATLSPGTRLSLGPDGYAKLAYADGTLVELQKNTSLTLSAGQKTRLFGLVTELRGKRIQLDFGMLAAQVAKQKAGEEMALATPNATATVKGTVLQLTVTQTRSELKVQEGTVELATGTQRELVGAGESAIVRDGILSKEGLHEDGAILFQDTFETGLRNWTLYTRHDTGNISETTEKQCPAISIVTADREGVTRHVAALTGGGPAGRRVGIVTKNFDCKSDAFSLNYEYTYEGHERPAMEGIEIYMETLVLAKGKTLPQAKPAGEWNQVRWEIVRANDPEGKGRMLYDAKLFFNGEYLGRRTENFEHASPGLMLEVIDGPFRFASVTIRELKK